MSKIKQSEIVEIRHEKHKIHLSEKGYEFFKHPTSSPYLLVAHPHIHDAIECLYVNCGSLRIYLDGKEERLEAGDLVICHSLGVHSLYTEEHTENGLYVLKLSTKLLYNYSPGDLAGKFALKFTSYNPKLKTVWRKSEIEGTDIEYGIKRLIREYESGSELQDLMAITSSLLILEGIYMRSFDVSDTSSGKSNLIFDSIVFINRHLDTKITEESVAREFDVSYSHFSREFKKATGKTFKDYLIYTRMDHAEQLLLNTDLQVSEIAASCGYSNISYFISLYKRIKGKTPLKVRKEGEKQS